MGAGCSAGDSVSSKYTEHQEDRPLFIGFREPTGM